MGTSVRKKVTESDELFTIGEASAYLDVSPQRLRRLCRERRLRHVRDGYLIKFYRADLDAFKDEQFFVVEPTPARSPRRGDVA